MLRICRRCFPNPRDFKSLVSFAALAQWEFRPLRRATKGAALSKPATFEKVDETFIPIYFFRGCFNYQKGSAVPPAPLSVSAPYHQRDIPYDDTQVPSHSALSGYVI